jgi:hypothetical protein
MFGHHASGPARRVDSLGVIETLRQTALDAYDRLIGLQLAEVAVDGCIAKAPCGGEKAGNSRVDRQTGQSGIKRSTAVDERASPEEASAPPPTATMRRFWSLPSSAPVRWWEC